MKINVKPLSVNQCWQGRRFKTKLYKMYELAILIALPDMEIPDGKLELHIQVGMSNKQADIDNVLKPFLDILQKKYGFNDNMIYHLCAYKRIVPKGAEYFSFEIFEAIETEH